MKREKIIRDLTEGKDVLDVGSVGQTDHYNLWEAYKDMNMKSLTGIDLAVAEDETLEHFNVRRSERDNSVVFGNMEDYQFGRQFDVIVAGDVLEHVENQALFLKNIHQHLKDDGVFILTTPNAKWPTVMFKPNPTHTLWHDRYTLDRILSMCQFKIDRTIYYPGNKKSYPFYLLPLLLNQGILMVCSKKK